MTRHLEKPRFQAASAVFDVLDPIPFGFLVAALVFDAVYVRTAEILWVKSAAWLIAIGLLFAIAPRLINMARVWAPHGGPRPRAELASFWLHLFGIVAAIVNAFVHSRDAYGVMPDGLWLSVLTVVAIAVARALPTRIPVTFKAP